MVETQTDLLFLIVVRRGVGFCIQVTLYLLLSFRSKFPHNPRFGLPENALKMDIFSTSRPEHQNSLPQSRPPGATSDYQGLRIKLKNAPNLR
jgi:hypothetical protein